MTNRVLSPVLVGRIDELSQLEDSLLSANRGEGRFVLLGGEAGIELPLPYRMANPVRA